MKKRTRGKNVRSNSLKELGAALGNGSVFTRLSFVFMGFGQVARGQFVKGALYFLTEAAFLLFMIFFGGRYIAHLFSGNLGTRLSGEVWNEELQIFEKTRGDNSFLILLYGVVSLVLVLFFLVVWAMNIKGSYENDKRRERGEAVRSFKEDLHLLLNEKFYVPLLTLPFLGLIVFTVMPLVFMVLIAFTN